MTFYSHGESNARGVAILVSKQLPVVMSDIARDDIGHFLLLDCKIYDTRYIIVNIYAPTIDKASEQKQFGEFLLSASEKYVGLNIIIGGDFNICLDNMLPSSSHTVTYSDCLIQLFDNLDLIDIWRLRHPSTKHCSRREKTRFCIKQTRINFFVISCHMEYETHIVDMLPRIKSDHSLLRYAFVLEGEQKRGKGLWKLNTSLLLDSDYISLINKTINHAKADFENLTNKTLAWEYLKCQIRTESITYAINKKKRGK